MVPPGSANDFMIFPSALVTSVPVGGEAGAMGVPTPGRATGGGAGSSGAISTGGGAGSSHAVARSTREKAGTATWRRLRMPHDATDS